MTLKFCKDCTCCVIYPDRTPAYWCTASYYYDLVTGQGGQRTVRADSMRLAGQACGPDGLLWQEKVQ